MDRKVCATWKVRPTPRRKRSRGAGAVMSCPSSSDRAAVGPELAADHVEDRRLAGAVRADEGQHLAALDREGHVARRHHAAERFAQALHAPAGSCGRARVRASRSERAPTRPRGNSQHHGDDAQARASGATASVSGMIWSRSTWSTPAPTSGPIDGLHAAEQQHGQRIDRGRDAEQARVDRALARRRRARRRARPRRRR